MTTSLPELPPSGEFNHDELFRRLVDTSLLTIQARITAQSNLPRLTLLEDEAGNLLDVELLDVLTAAKYRDRASFVANDYAITLSRASMRTGTETESVTHVENVNSFMVHGSMNLYPTDYTRALLADPDTLVRAFISKAHSVDAFMHLINVVNSAEYQATFFAAQGSVTEFGALRGELGRGLAAWTLKNPEHLDELQSRLFESLSPPDTESKIASFIPCIERGLTEWLQAEAKPGDFIFKAVARFIAPLEEAGLLIKNEPKGILTTAFAASEVPIAEVLLQRLSKQQVESRRRDMERDFTFARLFLRTILNKYAQDDTRHSANVQIVTEQIFPDKVRSDSMSRQGLLQLYDAVVQHRNIELAPEKRLPLAKELTAQVMGTALYQVLRITTVNDADPEIVAAHQSQDRLYAEIIDMLLERRIRPPKDPSNK